MTTTAMEQELARLHRELERERTLRKKAESRAESNDVANRLGHSTGEIVHELRNPLAGIEGFAGLARRGLAPDSPIHMHLERIETGVRRANRILSTMSDMARTPDLEHSTLPVEEIIRGALGMLALEHPAACDHLHLELNGPKQVHADSAAAKSALLELLRNAAESGADKIRLSTAFGAPGHLQISVTDNGPGIENIPRALRLFTTTRPGADGIGLPQVERFALLHGGRLVVESQMNEGTTATIDISCARNEPSNGNHEKDQP